MRIIPKKIKVKNTVWKCYSMPDIIVALVVFAIIFIAITAGNWAIAIIMGIAAVIMFMPTSDGIFYTCILENIKFIVSKKKYTKDAAKEKERYESFEEERVDLLILLSTVSHRAVFDFLRGRKLQLVLARFSKNRKRDKDVRRI